MVGSQPETSLTLLYFTSLCIITMRTYQPRSSPRHRRPKSSIAPLIFSDQLKRKLWGVSIFSLVFSLRICFALEVRYLMFDIPSSSKKYFWLIYNSLKTKLLSPIILLFPTDVLAFSFLDSRGGVLTWISGTRIAYKALLPDLLDLLLTCTPLHSGSYY